MIVKQYNHIYHEYISNGDSYTKIVFKLTEQYKIFPNYCAVFKPLRYNNEYNLKLIDLLIENSHLVLAEKYCSEQINANSKNEYNIPYLTRLRKIYVLKKDETNLAKIIEILIPFTFSFDDFLYLYNRMPEGEEKKKWRSKILSRAKNNCRDRHAEDFCFSLSDYEKRYTKMFEYIHFGSYENILRYFEQMANTDKAILLNSILNKTDEYFFFSNNRGIKNDEEIFPELLKVFLNHYSESYLRATIKKAEGNQWHYRLNRFVSYMKKELMCEKSN
jgi:hypothetical protein